MVYSKQNKQMRFSTQSIKTLVLVLLLAGINLSASITYPTQEALKTQTSQLECYQFSLASVTEAYFIAELEIVQATTKQDFSNFGVCLSSDNSAVVETAGEDQKVLRCSSTSLTDTIGKLSKFGRFSINFQKTAFPNSANLSFCIANLNKDAAGFSYKLTIKGKNVDTLCPFDCFQKGSCAKNECRCDQQYLGRDCGVPAQKVLTETKIELELLPKVYSYLKIELSESKFLKISNFQLRMNRSQSSLLKTRALGR